jgi:hypothetical protein
VCFFPDPESVARVPRPPLTNRTLWFCFKATPQARKAFAIPEARSSCGYQGTAKVIVRNYQPYSGEGDDHDVADLVRVINAQPPVELKCGAQSSLRGVWKVTEFSSREIGGEWKSSPINNSLYIFTAKHYSYMFVPGAGPRRLHAGDPNKPTDAEKVAAYDSIVAASGTYTLAGSTLELKALLHKNPNEMLGESLKYSIEIDGDVIRMTIVNAPFAPGRERRTTLARVE